MAKPKGGSSKGGNSKSGHTSRPSYPRNKPSTTGNESGRGRSNNTSGKTGKGK